MKEEILKQRYRNEPSTSDFNELTFSEEDLARYLHSDRNFSSEEDINNFFDHIYGANVKNHSSNELYLPDVDTD